MVIAKGQYGLHLSIVNGTFKVLLDGRCVLKTDNGHEAIGLLKGLSRIDCRDLLRKALINYSPDQDDDWADRIVEHLLGKPSMSDIMKGLIQ